MRRHLSLSSSDTSKKNTHKPNFFNVYEALCMCMCVYLVSGDDSRPAVVEALLQELCGLCSSRLMHDDTYMSLPENHIGFSLLRQEHLNPLFFRLCSGSCVIFASF